MFHQNYFLLENYVRAHVDRVRAKNIDEYEDVGDENYKEYASWETDDDFDDYEEDDDYGDDEEGLMKLSKEVLMDPSSHLKPFSGQ